MEAVKVELLEIERELAGPEGEAAMRRHDAVLAGLSGRLAEAMRAGVEPWEFARCEKLAEAVTVARKLLRVQRNGLPK